MGLVVERVLGFMGMGCELEHGGAERERAEEAGEHGWGKKVHIGSSFCR